MTRSIDSFGGDGSHEVHVQTHQGEQTVWVKRDLWFDRDDEKSWIVWAQARSWHGDEPLADDDALGSIVVTHPVVMAFLDQLGELLVNPARFRHEPEFVEDSASADDSG